MKESKKYSGFGILHGSHTGLNSRRSLGNDRQIVFLLVSTLF